MKFTKIVALALMAVSMFGSVMADEVTAKEKQYMPKDRSTCEKVCVAVLMYIPNRIVDAMDIFSVDLGLGPRAGVNVMATEAVAFGAQYGFSSDIIKGYDRQYGFGIEDGWNAHFLCSGAEDTERNYTVGTVKPYWFVEQGIYYPSQETYSRNIRDYWAFGLEASALVHAKVAIHPLAIADFITGLFFIDVIEKDDFAPRFVK